MQQCCLQRPKHVLSSDLLAHAERFVTLDSDMCTYNIKDMLQNLTLRNMAVFLKQSPRLRVKISLLQLARIPRHILRASIPVGRHVCCEQCSNTPQKQRRTSPQQLLSTAHHLILPARRSRIYVRAHHPLLPLHKACITKLSEASKTPHHLDALRDGGAKAPRRTGNSTHLQTCRVPDPAALSPVPVSVIEYIKNMYRASGVVNPVMLILRAREREWVSTVGDT